MQPPASKLLPCIAIILLEAAVAGAQFPPPLSGPPSAPGAAFVLGPRGSPVSPDILETGMVFNVEPAVYIEGYGGVRHCSMVAVTQSEAEILTPFQETPESLVVRSA